MGIAKTSRAIQIAPKPRKTAMSAVGNTNSTRHKLVPTISHKKLGCMIMEHSHRKLAISSIATLWINQQLPLNFKNVRYTL
jgi:hypothetical protein